MPGGEQAVRETGKDKQNAQTAGVEKIKTQNDKDK